jgi:ent-kaurenoic acid hydroxylase
LITDGISLVLQAEQEEIMRNIPPTQKGLNLRDFRKMEYLSHVNKHMLCVFYS